MTGKRKRPEKTTTTSSKRKISHPKPKTNGIGGTSQQAEPPESPALSSEPPQDWSKRVYVFGDGSSGELGLGAQNATDVAAPRLNPNLIKVKAIAAGGMHAVAVSSDHHVLTWGVNDQCALGRDTSWDGGLRDVDADSSDSDDADLNPLESMPGPVMMEDLPKHHKIIKVAAGDSATFALSDHGHVFGWGTFRDSNGVYGFTLDSKSGKIVDVQKTPMRIPNLENITDVSAGADFALALDKYGKVYSWGVGQQYELGHRIVERRRAKALLPTPVGFSRRVKIISVHAGNNHAFAIDAHGDCWSWGLNNFAQTGVSRGAGELEASIQQPTKVQSLAGMKMKMIDGGLHHSIAITQSGECLVWGRIDGGQLGLEIAKLLEQHPDSVTFDERQKPRILRKPTLLPIPSCTYVAAGSDHCIAVTLAGEAYSWGFNVNYQCGQGTSDDIWVARKIASKAIAGQKICWAGAGGQYSMLASRCES